MTSFPKSCISGWMNTQNLTGWKGWVIFGKINAIWWNFKINLQKLVRYMSIWTANKFVKFYAKRLNRSEFRQAARCGVAGGSCLFPATRTDEATPAWQAPARLTIARRSCTASRQILDDIPNIPNIPKSFRRVLYKNLNTGLVNMSQTRTVRYFGTG